MMYNRLFNKIDLFKSIRYTCVFGKLTLIFHAYIDIYSIFKTNYYPKEGRIFF